MSAIDDILALATPARLLNDARADGRGVSVAVIDSGIDRAAIAARHADSPIVEGAVFRQEKVLSYDGKHSSSHGTTVADIILHVAPKTALLSADVFGPSNSCEVETLIGAIRHALDVWQVKVINLSLGITEQKLIQMARRQQFLRIIEEAYYRDVIVVAAAHNEHPLTRAFPAIFAPPLVSVDKGLFENPLQFAYKLTEHVEFQAHSRGYLGHFANEPATSWAAPHITGIVAKLLSLKPELKPFEVKTILYWLSCSLHCAATPH